MIRYAEYQDETHCLTWYYASGLGETSTIISFWVFENENGEQTYDFTRGLGVDDDTLYDCVAETGTENTAQDIVCTETSTEWIRSEDEFRS